MTRQECDKITAAIDREIERFDGPFNATAREALTLIKMQVRNMYINSLRAESGLAVMA